VLDELAAFAPVRAVLGNNDTVDVAEWGAPAARGRDYSLGMPSTQAAYRRAEARTASAAPSRTSRSHQPP
jgi:hypothetical protein